jgi:3alpha(or 20beta)-hydroxysteroid dehydrogenase
MAMGRVDGKAALISGGARGMGASHARTLVAEGAKVVIGDLLDDEGKALVDELGDVARYVHLDVTQPEQWNAAAATTVEAFGRLDILVNNAGVFAGGLLPDTKFADWQRVIEINLNGTFLGMQAAVEPMAASGGGSIINISSVEGLGGSAWTHAYTASKFAVRGVTKSAAVELAPRGIRVNSIHPGFIRTKMTEAFPEDLLLIPLGRGGEAAEVSKFVLFLASDDSSYATGAEFVVDGGLTASLAHKQM